MGLDFGFRIFDFGFGILDVGFRILDFDERNIFWIGGTVLDAT